MNYFIYYNICVCIIFVFFSSILPSFSLQLLPEDGSCVMYGRCEGERDDVPCIYSGPAKPLDNIMVPATNMTSVQLLKAMCPDFVHDDNPHVCCSADQLQAFHGQMMIVEQYGLARCPSCMQNFRRLMCHFSCSPVQSRFIHVIHNFTNDDNEAFVVEVNYYVSRQYAETLYNSCRDMEGLVPGTYLMDMICGSWGSAHCSAERWTEFMGSTPEEGAYSPFKTNYILTPKDVVHTGDGFTFYPMNGTATKCSESPGPGYEKCNCSDCRDSCSVEMVAAPELEPVPEPFTILTFDGPSVIAVVVFLFFLY